MCSWSSSSYIFHLVGGFPVYKTTQEMCIRYCYLFNRYFREELKQRIKGKASPQRPLLGYKISPKVNNLKQFVMRAPGSRQLGSAGT